MQTIKYTSENGYTGVRYGESSLMIFDKNNKEVFHTRKTTVNTYEELVEQVESYPDFYNKLLSLKQKGAFDDE